MLRFTFFSIFCLIFFSLSAQQTTESKENWIKFKSETGRFSVYTPNSFIEKIDSLQTALGVLKTYTFYHQPLPNSGNSNFMYMIQYIDYPEGSLDVNDESFVADFFESTRNEAAFSINGKVIYATPISLNNFPGQFWRINYKNDSAVIKTKAYLVKNRYYSIQTITFKSLASNMDTDKFFDSFQILVN